MAINNSIKSPNDFSVFQVRSQAAHLGIPPYSQLPKFFRGIVAYTNSYSSDSRNS